MSSQGGYAASLPWSMASVQASIEIVTGDARHRALEHPRGPPTGSSRRSVRAGTSEDCGDRKHRDSPDAERRPDPGVRDLHLKPFELPSRAPREQESHHTDERGLEHEREDVRLGDGRDRNRPGGV